MQVTSSAGAQSRPPMNPRADMDNRISAAVKAGSISETDATALEGALDSIDSSLQSGASSGSKLDPSEMKSRIDSLISGQVDAGTLTSDQAAELQSMFAQGPSNGGGQPPEMASGDATTTSAIEGTQSTGAMQGMGGCGGPNGAGGPPPPPPGGSADGSDSSSDDSSTSVDDVLASMQAFLDNLRASMASSTYSTSSTDVTTSSSGLIVDQLA